MRTILLLWIVVQLLRGAEGAAAGDHQVLVTVRSLRLLESKCAECYGEKNATIRHNECCDGNSTDGSFCPDSCDLLLRFCQLADLQPFRDLPVDTLLNTQCGQSTVFSHAEGLLKNNLMAGVTHRFGELGQIGSTLALRNPVTYYEPGRWKGAQLNISVVDRDFGQNDFDDLIDRFMIPINISVGSSVTMSITGIYNYVELELTIEVRCAADNTDGNCSCLPGFTGQSCEVNIDDCVGVTCSGRGACVDGVQSFSCYCDPGYTGTRCESEEAPLSAIIGGAVGGVLLLVVLVILVVPLALCVFKQRQNRTKTIDVQAQGTTYDNFNSSGVLLQGGDIHIYEEAIEDQARTSGSETLNKFNNAVYGEMKKLEHEHKYDSTDEVHSSSRDHSDQYQEFERKFENPIYGNEDDQTANNTAPQESEHEFKNPIYGEEDAGGYLNDSIPAHERDIDYDQVGNVYHTLESEWERQQRYAGTGQTEASPSLAVDSLARGETGKPKHNYEDMT